MSPDKQLQRTVIPQHVRAANASFHHALAARWTAPRAAAQLRRHAALLLVTLSYRLSRMEAGTMRFVGLFVALGVSGSLPAAESSPIDVLRSVFPRSTEITLALSGAPPHLRESATVYAYGDEGYEKVRAGSNGMTCLLNRDAFYYGARQFKPTCWDDVGAATYVPVMLKVGELLAKNQSQETIRSTIDAGFARGQFRAPTTGGVAYMIAGDIELDPKTGAVRRQTFPGHYMFYAIGATPAQLGVTRAALEENPTLPTVFTGGAGGAQGLSYIIVAPQPASSRPRAERPVAAAELGSQAAREAISTCPRSTSQ